MASNTKQAVKEAMRKRAEYTNNYEALFRLLFHNSVKINNLPEKLPKRYLLNTLLNKGAIAYDKETKLFLPFAKGGIDVYGLPTTYFLIGYNGFYKERNADDVVIIRANDLMYPISNYLSQQVEKLVEFDVSIAQNLEAIKTMTIIRVGEKSSLLTLANIDNARRIGSMIAYTDKEISLSDNLSVASTGAEYIVDKLQENKRIVVNETLSVIGIGSSNTDKRERVQSMEVLASFGFAKNCIKTLVETVNYDCEVGGLNMRFEENTELNYNLEEKENVQKPNTI